jgi:RimJ/RimL family protein N-acetyltransferase
MIETARLILREFREQDLAALHALVSNVAVMQSSDGVEDEARARKRLEGYQASYRQHGFGKWAVELKGSGKVIGYCGFGLEEFDGKCEPELGFRLLPEFWGSGLATEAAEVCSQYAWAKLKFPRFLGFAHPANGASRRVLEKIGMRELGDRTFHGGPVVVYVSPDRGSSRTPDRTAGGTS